MSLQGQSDPDFNEPQALGHGFLEGPRLVMVEVREAAFEGLNAFVCGDDVLAEVLNVFNVG